MTSLLKYLMPQQNPHIKFDLIETDIKKPLTEGDEKRTAIFPVETVHPPPS